MTDDYEIDRQLRSVMVTLAREAEPPTGFTDRMVDALETARDVAAPTRRVVRWLLPAAAAVSIALVAGALAFSYGFQHEPTPPSRSASTGPVLTPRQRTLALHVAHAEAEGSNPRRPGPIVPVRGWPDYVTSVSATLMTRTEALRFLDNSTSSRPGGTQVLVIQLRGRFGFVTSAPPPQNGRIRSRVARGNVITAIASLTDGQVTDVGIGPRHRALPGPTVLYQK